MIKDRDSLGHAMNDVHEVTLLSVKPILYATNVAVNS
jgi:hypothetical protein